MHTTWRKGGKVELPEQTNKLERVAEKLSDLNDEGFKRAVREALDAGIPANQLIFEGMSKGMEIIGEKYETGEYFLMDLVVAGQLMKEEVMKLESLLLSNKKEIRRKVVIGTVQGDLHDIGKSLVASMLIGIGFQVYDLGIDVPPEKFVDKVKEVNADLLALSSLLTVTAPAIGKVIQALEKAGLRNQVKILVGGRAVTQEYAKEIHADGYAANAIDAASKARKLMEAF